MLDCKNKKERLLTINHGEYKGEIYKKSKNIIFIESNFEQALKICEISGKQVFCVDKRKLITPNNLISNMQILNSEFKIVAKRTIKKLLKKIK